MFLLCYCKYIVVFHNNLTAFLQLLYYIRVSDKTAKIMKTLTIKEAATTIKEERLKQRYTKREVGSWINQPYQRIDQLEDPDNKGSVANKQRSIILSKLLNTSVREPEFIVENEGD